MLHTVRSYTSVRGGFTLVETLLAIAVLTVAIAGPLTIASKGLSAALIAKDQTTAYYLAQDAIEYVRFVRDSNRLEGRADWLAGLDGTPNDHTNGATGGSAPTNQCHNYPGVVSPNGAACIVDTILDTTLQCGSGTGVAATTLCGDFLKYNSATGQYGYTSGADSIFQRSLLIRCGGATSPSTGCLGSREASVLVTVQWKDVGGVQRQVTASENLFNWQ